MNRRIALTVFALVAALQLAVPAYLIFRYENVLRHGTLHRFRTRPVDPYDAFRGRYVRLSVDAATTTSTASQGLERGDWVYATLQRDADGFSRFGSLATERPAAEDYVRTRVADAYDWIRQPSSHANATTTGSLGSRDFITGKGQTVTLEIPFDRYFMEEGVAPRAERLTREHSRRANSDAEVWVRVLAGDTVVQDLVVGGLPIREYMRENPERKELTHP